MRVATEMFPLIFTAIKLFYLIARNPCYSVAWYQAIDQSNRYQTEQQNFVTRLRGNTQDNTYRAACDRPKSRSVSMSDCVIRRALRKCVLRRLAWMRYRYLRFEWTSSHFIITLGRSEYRDIIKKQPTFPVQLHVATCFLKFLQLSLETVL